MAVSVEAWYNLSLIHILRIYAGAADGNVHVQTDLVIDHTERNGVRRAEFIVDEFLRIKII